MSTDIKLYRKCRIAPLIIFFRWCKMIITKLHAIADADTVARGDLQMAVSVAISSTVQVMTVLLSLGSTNESCY